MSNALKEKVTFCRRKKNSGIYTGNIGGKVIRLMDREVYTPDNSKEAKFLMEDPEIEILCVDENEQKREDERKKEQENVSSSVKK